MQHVNVLALELVQKYSDRELSHLITCIESMRGRETKASTKLRTRVEAAREFFPRLKEELVHALKTGDHKIVNAYLANRGGKVYLTVDSEPKRHYDYRRQAVTNALCQLDYDLRQFCNGWHVTSSNTTSTTFRMNPDPR